MSPGLNFCFYLSFTIVINQQKKAVSKWWITRGMKVWENFTEKDFLFIGTQKKSANLSCSLAKTFIWS